jgi:predicted RNase H-like HicB family nuclease
MNAEDKYLKFVKWSEEDNVYVGYCPDLFPFDGVCHGNPEEHVFHQLVELVRNEVVDLQRDQKPLPTASTRPMREAVPA